MASSKDHADIAKLLLEAGADKDAQTNVSVLSSWHDICAYRAQSRRIKIESTYSLVHIAFLYVRFLLSTQVKQLRWVTLATLREIV